MIFDSLLGAFSVDMGIDLGTCNTLVCVKGEGKLIDELNKQDANDIIVVAGGVIPKQDYEFLKKAGVKDIFGPGTAIPIAAENVLEKIEESLGK